MISCGRLDFSNLVFRWLEARNPSFVRCHPLRSLDVWFNRTSSGASRVPESPDLCSDLRCDGLIEGWVCRMKAASEHRLMPYNWLSLVAVIIYNGLLIAAVSYNRHHIVVIGHSMNEPFKV